MSITSVDNTLNTLNNNTVLTNAAANKKNVGTGNLDKNSFLQLLMAQLKYQDPTNPTDTKDMITQQAQLTQVDTLNQLNATIKGSSQLSAASGLIGKRVEVKGADGVAVQGLVSTTQLGTKGVSVIVNGKNYEASQVSQIFAN
jgi:flagellar basal-body rod modification protein FlgD